MPEFSLAVEQRVTESLSQLLSELPAATESMQAQEDSAGAWRLLVDHFATRAAQTAIAAMQPSGRLWRFAIKAPVEWLTTNEQRSSKKHWKVQADAIAEWRGAGYAYALTAGLRRVRLDAVEVDMLVRFPDDPTIRDSPNVYPAIKAVIDGALVDTRVLPDDNDRYVRCLSIRPGPPIPLRPYQPAGELVVTVREVPAGA